MKEAKNQTQVTRKIGAKPRMKLGNPKRIANKENEPPNMALCVCTCDITKPTKKKQRVEVLSLESSIVKRMQDVADSMEKADAKDILQSMVKDEVKKEGELELGRVAQEKGEESANEVAKEPEAKKEMATEPMNTKKDNVNVVIHAQGKKSSKRPETKKAEVMDDTGELLLVESIVLSKSTRTLLSEAGTDLLEVLHEDQRANHPEGSLETHSISRFLRAKMVNWMVEVMSGFHLSRRCFFLAVALMDNFYLKTTWHCDDADVHLTGVTCIYMASKLEEVRPLRLRTIYSRIGYNVLPMSSIIQREKDIACVLDFRLLLTTPMPLLDIYIAKLISMLEAAGHLPNESAWQVMSKLKEGAVLYAILAAYDYDMLKYYPSTLAAGAIYATAIKLTAVYQQRHEQLLVAAMKALSNGDEENVKELEDCAQDIVKLEASFDTKFEGLNYVFVKVMAP